MKYTTYYEQSRKIDKLEERTIKETLSEDKLLSPFETIIVRKLTFSAITTNVSEIHYSICMIDYDCDSIYLQRKNIQNGTTYKTIAHITKEECTKLLEGDYEWLKDNKQQLCKEFYLQLTVNQLQIGNLKEIHKEICHKKQDYISFTHCIKGISYHDHNFFDKNCYMIPCLSDHDTILTIKNAVTIPRYIRNMVHMGNENADLTDLAFTL